MKAHLHIFEYGDLLHFTTNCISGKVEQLTEKAPHCYVKISKILGYLKYYFLELFGRSMTTLQCKLEFFVYCIHLKKKPKCKSVTGNLFCFSKVHSDIVKVILLYLDDFKYLIFITLKCTALQYYWSKYCWNVRWSSLDKLSEDRKRKSHVHSADLYTVVGFERH